MRGIIIYDRQVAAERTWYIGKYAEAFERRGVRLELAYTDDVRRSLIGERDLDSDASGASGSDVDLGPSGASVSDVDFGLSGASGSDVDFAIMRDIAPDLSALLEKNGIRVFNSSAVAAICNDKLKTYEFMADRELADFMPVFSLPVAAEEPTRQGQESGGAVFATVRSLPAATAEPARQGQESGGAVFATVRSLPVATAEPARQGQLAFPLVLKSKAGHGGTEVFWIKNEAQLSERLLGRNQDDYLLQQPCDTPGIDVRVYVVGGEIVAAMKRINANDGDIENRFKSNYCLGGRCEVYDIEADQKMRGMVRRICDALYLDFAGIDFIFHKGEPVFNEIEDVVGARMIYDHTDIDIVEMYVEHIVKKLAGMG